MKSVKIYLLMLSAVFASCLEDDKQPLDPTGAQNIIEFLDPSVPASPSGAIYPVYSSSFLLSPQDEYEILVSNSGPNDDYSEAIELTLTVDPSALDQYNQQMRQSLHGTQYELMPTDNYSIASMTVTIPAGQKTVAVPITVFPEKFEFGRNFAVPLRIQSASSGILSAHFSVAILSLGVRNQYDGIYDIIDGQILRHNAGGGTDPALSGDYVDGLTIDLVTLSSNSVSFAPLWKDGSGIAGIDGTSITINPDNTITVQSSGNGSLENMPGYENSYDPATQTFTINIHWGPTLREIYGLKLQYAGPRP